MTKVYLVLKQLAVWMKGVPFSTAKCFSDWKGGANHHLLKYFEVNNSEVHFKVTHTSFPLALLNCFDRDVNFLYDTCRRFVPESKDGMLQLTASRSDTVIKVLLDSAQNTFVFNEVFYQEVYGFYLSQNCVIVDVGMNIGMASLYFASCPLVDKIYSFELLSETYDMAIRNFNLNKSIAAKIVAHNFGWGVEDGEYLLDNTRSGATDTTIMNLQNTKENLRESGVVVQVKSAEGELRKIFELHSATPIVLKLDVEGIEYELLQNLLDEGALHKLHGVMLEWHNKGPEKLLSMLSEAGFKSTYRMDPFFEGKLGMIYSWR